MSNELKIDFFWVDDKIQFFQSSENSNFLVVIVADPHY